METIQLNPKAQKLLRQIKSIKKSKEINPKLEELEDLFLKQLEGLDVQINQLREENRRLNTI